MSDLEVTTENGIATFIMNRPDARNALSMDMRKQLAEALHDAEPVSYTHLTLPPNREV